MINMVDGYKGSFGYKGLGFLVTKDYGYKGLWLQRLYLVERVDLVAAAA